MINKDQLINKEWFRSLADASKSNNSLRAPDSSGAPPTDTYYGDNFFEQFPVSEIASAGLIHIDGGTFELVRNLLEKSEKQLMPGVLILFGELIGYPNWRNGQYRAWTEIAKIMELSSVIWVFIIIKLSLKSPNARCRTQKMRKLEPSQFPRPWQNSGLCEQELCLSEPEDTLK